MNPFKGKAGSSGNFEMPEEGQHLAVIAGFVDLGTHTEPGYNGSDERTLRKCMLLYELVNEQKQDGTNHIVGVEYNASLNLNSNIVKTLSKIRGKEYSEDDDIDLAACVGKMCQVLISHQESQKGKTYSKVADVTAAPKGTKPVKPSNSLLIFIMDTDSGEDIDLPEHDWLPYSFGVPIADKIRKSPEWKQISGESPTPQAKKSVKSAAVAEADEVPF